MNPCNFNIFGSKFTIILCRVCLFVHMFVRLYVCLFILIMYIQFISKYLADMDFEVLRLFYGNIRGT